MKQSATDPTFQLTKTERLNTENIPVYNQYHAIVTYPLAKDHMLIYSSAGDTEPLSGKHDKLAAEAYEKFVAKTLAATKDPAKKWVEKVIPAELIGPNNSSGNMR